MRTENGRGDLVEGVNIADSLELLLEGGELIKGLARRQRVNDKEALTIAKPLG